MAKGQSTAWMEAAVRSQLRGPPSAGQAEPRTSTAYSPHGGYAVKPADKMAPARAKHRRKKRNKRSQPFIDPEGFVVHVDEGVGESFTAMFEIAFPAPAMGKSPQGLQYTVQPVGSFHGLGTSPSAATAPTGPGRFMNVVDGPEIKRQRRPTKRHRKPSIAKMVRGVSPRS